MSVCDQPRFWVEPREQHRPDIWIGAEDLQNVIRAAKEIVSADHFRRGRDFCFNRLTRRRIALRECDLDPKTQPGLTKVNVGNVAPDHAVCFKAAHSAEAGARREADNCSHFLILPSRIKFEHLQNAAIELVNVKKKR